MEQSLAAFRQEVKAAGAEPADVLRVTCFLSSLENLAATRQLVETEYPRAAHDYVQTERAPGRAVAACEGVARLRSAPDTPLSFVPAEGFKSEPGQSPVALVGAPQVVLTGTQISFGYQEQDSRLAFERLKKELDQSGVSLRRRGFRALLSALPRNRSAGSQDPRRGFRPGSSPGRHHAAVRRPPLHGRRFRGGRGRGQVTTRSGTRLPKRRRWKNSWRWPAAKYSRRSC